VGREGGGGRGIGKKEAEVGGWWLGWGEGEGGASGVSGGGGAGGGG